MIFNTIMSMDQCLKYKIVARKPCKTFSQEQAIKKDMRNQMQHYTLAQGIMIQGMRLEKPQKTICAEK